MKFINRALFWIVAISALFLLNVLLYKMVEGTFAVLTYGDETAVAHYASTALAPAKDDAQKKDQDPAAPPQPESTLNQSTFSPKDIFSLLISIEIALLLAFGNPIFRAIFSRFSHPAMGADLHALCIGIGGIGKTTLIRKYYGKSVADVHTTTKFEYVKLQQPIDNRTCTVSLFDFVGQDFPSLSPAIHALSNRRIDINLLIIILGLHKVERNTSSGKYFVNIPGDDAERDEMFESMINEQISQMFTKSTLTMVVNNLPKLERVVVVFNQADLLIMKNERGVTTVDCRNLVNSMKARFVPVTKEIEAAVEVHRDKYKTGVPIEYRVASIINGIEFLDDAQGQCIKPISIIEDTILKRRGFSSQNSHHSQQ
jgi:hypothetical protein